MWVNSRREFEETFAELKRSSDGYIAELEKEIAELKRIPDPLITKALRQRFVVTLPKGEGIFTGVMVDHDDTYYQFEDSQEVPRPGAGAGKKWPGRIWVKHATSPPPLLQEIEPRYDECR
jgi:hypothetical protein